jgi:hypothetical protein
VGRLHIIISCHDRLARADVCKPVIFLVVQPSGNGRTETPLQGPARVDTLGIDIQEAAPYASHADGAEMPVGYCAYNGTERAFRREILSAPGILRGTPSKNTVQSVDRDVNEPTKGALVTENGHEDCIFCGLEFIFRLMCLIN